MSEQMHTQVPVELTEVDARLEQASPHAVTSPAILTRIAELEAALDETRLAAPSVIEDLAKLAAIRQSKEPVE